jgi:hypothetical protein
MRFTFHEAKGLGTAFRETPAGRIEMKENEPVVYDLRTVAHRLTQQMLIYLVARWGTPTLIRRTPN